MCAIGRAIAVKTQNSCEEAQMKLHKSKQRQGKFMHIPMMMMMAAATATPAIANEKHTNRMLNEDKPNKNNDSNNSHNTMTGPYRTQNTAYMRVKKKHQQKKNLVVFRLYKKASNTAMSMPVHLPHSNSENQNTSQFLSAK